LALCGPCHCLLVWHCTHFASVVCTPGILTMQFIASLLLVLLSFTPAASAARAHPVEDVLTLLQALVVKVKDEGATEEGLYNKYMEWCATSTGTLEKAITSSKEDIDSLYDAIKSNEAKIDGLTKDIEYLSQEVADKEASKLAAQTDRDAANSLYTKNDEDYATTITAIGQAISELDASKPALLDVSRKLVKLPMVLEQLSDVQRQAIINLAQQRFVPNRNTTTGSKVDEEMRKAIKGVESYVGAGGVDYIFKSGTVLELLTSLKTHFENEQLEATKAETAAVNEHALADAALTQAIGAAGDLNTSKTQIKGDTEVVLAQNQADLADNKAELKADSDTLEQTQSSCATKTSEWKERSKIRDHEIKALEEAQWILSKVIGVQTAPPEVKDLPTSTVDFVQVHSISMKADDPRSKAIDLLRKEAQRSRSKSFSDFAMKVTSKLQAIGAGPFDQVINMIQKMIFRLMAEQKDEDEHKMWCDLETNKTIVSKEAKAAKVTALGLEIGAGNSKIQVLADDIEDKTGKIAQIKSWKKEAIELRQDNKKTNDLAIEDALAAQAALAKAIAVIKAYYEDTGKIAISFVAEPAPVELPEEPSTWAASYTGTADPKSQPDGIITVLKAVMADFSKMEADTKAQDATEQTKFNEDMRANEVAQAEYMTLVETKTEEKNRMVEKVNVWEDQKKHVQGELEATEQYYKDLGGACRDADSTYDERKSARSDEITALKQAQTILASAFEDSLLQQKKVKPSGFLQLRPVRRLHA